MIQLYQFAPAFGLPNASPFCLKLETYLRMAELEFETPCFAMDKLGKAPKGKMPYIADNGKLIADSSIIIEHLKQTYGDTLDTWLSAPEKAVALAFQRMMEENLYWAVVHTRWVNPQGWEKTRAAFFDAMPLPLRWFVPALARRGLIKQLHGQGMGRHSEHELLEIGKRDITAIADFLGDKPYFMGQQPCSLDATAFGFLANLVWPPIESELKAHARRSPQLEAYCARMRAQYFPDH
jgi:glutathione S-transferase